MIPTRQRRDVFVLRKIGGVFDACRLVATRLSAAAAGSSGLFAALAFFVLALGAVAGMVWLAAHGLLHPAPLAFAGLALEQNVVNATIRGKDETGPAFKSAQQHAESFGGKLKETLNKPFEILKGLVAVEAVRWFGEFAKGAVEAAAEHEAAWGRVEQAVANAGVGFAGVRSELTETFEAMSKGTRYEATDVTSAFGELLNITNDYSGSLKNMRLVMDIAAARQIDLGSAAMLVGKAMDGQVGMLKRYGIVVKDSGHAMEELSARFSGFAERDGKTLEGRLHQVANAWQEVKEKIGDALGNADGFATSSGHVVTALQQMSKWVDENKTNISELSATVATLVGWLGKLAGYTLGSHGVGGILGLIGSGYARLGEGAGTAYSAIRGIFTGYGVGEDMGGDASYEAALARAHARAREESHAKITANAQAKADEAAKDAAEKATKAADKHVDDLKKEVDLLAKKRGLLGLTIDDYQKLDALYKELARISKDAAEPLARREAAAEGAAAAAPFSLTAVTARDLKRSRGFGVTGIGTGLERGKGVASIGGVNLQGPTAAHVDPTQLGIMGEIEAGSAGAIEQLHELEKSVGSLGQQISTVGQSAVVDLFGAWGEGIASAIAGHQKLGQAILLSARRSIGGAMVAEGQQALYKAALAAIGGLTNPAEFLQAARYLATGTAEIAAGAAMMGGGSSGGPSGASSGVGPSGFQAAQRDVGNSGKTTVLLNGSRTDYRNPDDLDALAAMLRELGITGDIEFVVGGASA